MRSYTLDIEYLQSRILGTECMQSRILWNLLFAHAYILT